MFTALPDICSDSLCVNNKSLKNSSNLDWHIGIGISENIDSMLGLPFQTFHSTPQNQRNPKLALLNLLRKATYRTFVGKVKFAVRIQCFEMFFSLLLSVIVRAHISSLKDNIKRSLKTLQKASETPCQDTKQCSWKVKPLILSSYLSPPHFNSKRKWNETGDSESKTPSAENKEKQAEKHLKEELIKK